jgi:hypothetical protein
MGGNIAFAGSKRPGPARLIAVLLCLCFLATLVLSAAFIVTHANHEHDHNGAGGDCATCAHISAAGNLLKTDSAAVALLTVTFGAGFTARLILPAARLAIADSTLISLKVRLNN